MMMTRMPTGGGRVSGGCQINALSGEEGGRGYDGREEEAEGKRRRQRGRGEGIEGETGRRGESGVGR